MFRLFVVSTIACLMPGIAAAQTVSDPSSVEAQLCRAQLELLTGGGKLTDEEADRFATQCECLAQRAGDEGEVTCIDEQIG